MGVIARRFRWLEILFPPAQADPPNPSVVSADISLVHQVLSGTERFDEAAIATFTSPAGVAFIDSVPVPAGKYHYVFACSAFHNDPVAREVGIFINLVNDFAIASSGRAVPINRPITVPRAFTMPPRSKLRANVDAIAAGQSVSLRVLSLELAIGEPVPPT